MQTKAESPLQSAVATGLRAMRANLAPGLVLQASALAIVVAYFAWPPATEALQRLTEFRGRVGLPFAMVSTALCGGLIPWLCISLLQGPEHRIGVGRGLLTCLFWAYKGVEVSLFYSLLAGLVGEGNSVFVIIPKVFVDQFVYAPLLAIPGTVLFYSWVEYGYSVRPFLRDLAAPGWYLRRVLTPLVANLGIWLPATVIIYALPTSLQLPMQNLVLVFFTLILSRVARHAKPASEAQ